MGKVNDKGVERRDQLIEDVELRVDEETGAPSVSGYAAVFNSPSEKLFEWDKGPFREMVMPGAFSKTLREQNVPLLVEHANLPLATTRAGTLELAEDDHGLRFSSVLDPTDPDVQRLLPKMRRGDMSKCSFGFVPIREDPLDHKTKPPMRRLREVQLFDVSIVARPAYPATEAKVRRILAEDGLDAESIAELFVRLRMGFELDEEQRAVLERLTVTLNRFREDATAADDGPVLGGEILPTGGHPGERAQPAMQTGGPGMEQEPHPMTWYREQLRRMGA